MLQTASTEFFSVSGGARQNASKVLTIVMVKQPSHRAQVESTRELETLRQKGVKLLMIAVDNDPTKKTLERMAGDKDKVAVVSSPNDLATVLGKVEETSGDATGERIG